MLNVLMVTKPLAPPWDDSARNLARDVVRGVTDVRFYVLTAGDYSFKLRHVREERLYAGRASYQPPLWNNIKVFFRLLKPDEIGLYHFFFAPNLGTSLIASIAMGMKGRQNSIQTACSAPASFEGAAKLLFSDVTVAVSDWTRRKFIEAGAGDVRRIYPAVAATVLPGDEEIRANRKRFGLPENGVLALYAGDLEFSNAAETLFSALPEALKNDDLYVIYCNRAKTPEAASIRENLKKRVMEAGYEKRVFFVPSQEDMQALLRAIDILVMNPDTLYAKMDLPLVLLEAMANGKPAILGDMAPLTEAFQGEEAGLLVAPGDASGLASALMELAGDPSLRVRLGETARALANGRFSMKRLSEEYRNLYAEFE